MRSKGKELMAVIFRDYNIHSSSCTMPSDFQNVNDWELYKQKGDKTDSLSIGMHASCLVYKGYPNRSDVL
jgi:hypothetical protein